jgi:hypothetical protein
MIEEQNTPTYTVTCAKIAAALRSVGVIPAQIPFLKREMHGKRFTTYYFTASNPEGDMQTEKLIVASNDPYKWVEENPEHPFSFALVAILNYEKQAEAVATSRALVAFDMGGGKTLYIFEGSRRHAKMIERMKKNRRIKLL